MYRLKIFLEEYRAIYKIIIYTNKNKNYNYN